MTTVTGFGLLATSCYTLQPSLVAEPAPGTRLAFAINDVGRAALGGSMGPELLRVDGSLQSKDGSEYIVSVAGVELLQGGYQTWAGETVKINSSYVSAVYERKFSAGKTILATAVGIGGAFVIANSRAIRSAIDPDDPPPDTGLTKRGRMPLPGDRTGFPPFLRSLNPPRSY